MFDVVIIVTLFIICTVCVCRWSLIVVEVVSGFHGKDLALLFAGGAREWWRKLRESLSASVRGKNKVFLARSTIEKRSHSPLHSNACNQIKAKVIASESL